MNHLISFFTALSMALPAQAQQAPTCGGVFNNQSTYQRHHYTTQGHRPDVDYSKGVDYLIRSSDGARAYLSATEILPHLDIHRRLTIGISNGHVYLQYKGRRLDSSGPIGIRVTSFLKNSALIYGDMAFVLYDLSPSVLAKLDRMLTDFTPRSKVTCVAAACSYLADLKSAELPGNHVKVSSLLNTLIEMKLTGKKVAIVSLNGRTMEQQNEVIEKIEGRALRQTLLRGQILLGFTLGVLVALNNDGDAENE